MVAFPFNVPLYKPPKILPLNLILIHNNYVNILLQNAFCITFWILIIDFKLSQPYLIASSLSLRSTFYSLDKEYSRCEGKACYSVHCELSVRLSSNGTFCNEENLIMIVRKQIFMG
jgi:hypothetical protein